MKIPHFCVVIAPPTAGKTTLVKTINEGLPVEKRVAGDLDYIAARDIPQEIKALHANLINAYFKPEVGMKLFTVSREIDLNALNPENLTVYLVYFTEARWQQLPEVASDRGDSNEGIERMTASRSKYANFDEMNQKFGKRLQLVEVTLDRDEYLTGYFEKLFGENDSEATHAPEVNSETETSNDEPLTVEDGPKTEDGTLNDESVTDDAERDDNEKPDQLKGKSNTDVGVA